MARLMVPAKWRCNFASTFITISVRHKSFKVKRKWAATLTKSKSANDLALQHFDFFYKPIFQRDWPSVRLGFLSDPKYCALVNSYGQSDKIIRNLEEMGTYDLLEPLRKMRERSQNASAVNSAFNETDSQPQLSQLHKTVETDFNTIQGNSEFINMSRTDPSSLLEFTPATPKPKDSRVHLNEEETEPITPLDDSWIDQKIPIVLDQPVDYPAHLHAMSFPPGNISVFPQAPPNNGVVSYYLMDAASLLPVLALNLQPGDLVLDLCAAPGGKSLIMLQTLYPGGLVCNEPNSSRMNRLRQVLDCYLPGTADIRDNIVLKHKDAALSWDEIDKYDKVLIDAPCTADRQSLVGEESDGNIFKRSRSQERSTMPNLQTEILFNGLKSLRRGGTLVYATCSLSPLQNDGVVERAMQKIWRKTTLEFIVKDLTPLVEDFKQANICKFSSCTAYGKLVVPYILSNFGPMYFCKFQRIK